MYFILQLKTIKQNIQTNILFPTSIDFNFIFSDAKKLPLMNTIVSHTTTKTIM
jgi:hypothetical protein